MSGGDIAVECIVRVMNIPKDKAFWSSCDSC